MGIAFLILVQIKLPLAPVITTHFQEQSLSAIRTAAESKSYS